MSIKKLFILLIIFLTFNFSAFPGFYQFTAAQEPTGTIFQVGPVESVGTVSPTGPQGDTGVISIEESQTLSAASLGNDLTGAGSENVNASTQTTELDVSNDTQTQIANEVELDLNSGQNNLQNNTTVGTFETGQIDASLSLINLTDSSLSSGSSIGVATLNGSQTGNLIIPENGLPSQLLIPDATNSQTGRNSSNLNSVDNHSFVSFLNNSSTNFDNTIDISANTGENSITDNTKVLDINTGDINLGLNLLNFQGLRDTVADVDVWSILNDFHGDIIIPSSQNATTGSNSLNSNNTSNTVDSEISSNIQIDVNNTINIETNTGNNTLDSNTQLGNVETGKTKTESAVLNLVSTTSPIFYIINVFGRFLGSTEELSGINYQIVDQNGLQNSQTGPDSININSIDSENEINIDNREDTVFSNNVRINANTGGNQVSRNTQLGNFETGAINVIQRIVNAKDFPGKNLKLRIINIFGDWFGNLKKEKKPEQEQQPKPTGPVVVVPEVPEKPTEAPEVKGEVDVRPTDREILPTRGERGGAEEPSVISAAADVPTTSVPGGDIIPEAGPSASLWNYLIAPIIGLMGITGIEILGRIRKRKLAKAV